jgi:D-alanyl-D-alanine carboxypeptidase
MAYAIENQMAKEILFSTDTYTFQSNKFYTTKDPDKKVTYYPVPEWYAKDVRFNKKVQLESAVVVAGKTGYIDESGVSLVSIAKSDSGKYYINVIVGQPKGSGLTESISTNEVKQIYNTYAK